MLKGRYGILMHLKRPLVEHSELRVYKETPQSSVKAFTRGFGLLYDFLKRERKKEIWEIEVGVGVGGEMGGACKMLSEWLGLQ